MEHVPVCNNCGIRGHVYRECRKPVMSYGHLIFKGGPSDPSILMILRKDSLCYADFLRGKYKVHNVSYIQTLLDKCSLAEKATLLTSTFDELWVRLWRLPSVTQMEMKYHGDYQSGKDKYEALVKGFQTKTLGWIDLKLLVACSSTRYETSEWEFPKGRRNPGERNKECAIREFCEETGYQPDDYSLLLNVRPFEEEYMGENNVRYKHVYYVGYLTNTEKVPFIDETNTPQVSEIKDIRWFSQREALAVLRDYHHTRVQVINQVFDFLRGLDSEYSIVDSLC